jgi:hypothetical protein
MEIRNDSLHRSRDFGRELTRTAVCLKENRSITGSNSEGLFNLMPLNWRKAPSALPGISPSQTRFLVIGWKSWIWVPNHFTNFECFSLILYRPMRRFVSGYLFLCPAPRSHETIYALPPASALCRQQHIAPETPDLASYLNDKYERKMCHNLVLLQMVCRVSPEKYDENL